MTTGRINKLTASVLAGPGGPHRRACVRFDTTPYFLDRGGRCQPPDGYALPRARAGSTDARDNLVIDCATSALWFYETCRRLRTARVRLPMAASAV